MTETKGREAMIKTELQTAADKLVREIFGVKAGESVVLTADPDLPIEPLAAALCACDVWI